MVYEKRCGDVPIINVTYIDTLYGHHSPLFIGNKGDIIWLQSESQQGCNLSCTLCPLTIKCRHYLNPILDTFNMFSLWLQEDATMCAQAPEVKLYIIEINEHGKTGGFKLKIDRQELYIEDYEEQITQFGKNMQRNKCRVTR